LTQRCCCGAQLINQSIWDQTNVAKTTISTGHTISFDYIKTVKANMIISSRHRSAVLAVLVAAVTWQMNPAVAFVPPTPRNLVSVSANYPSVASKYAAASNAFVPQATLLASSRGRAGTYTVTRTRSALQMAAEDFSEAKYTEAAWSVIAALTKVADYYSASTVESPFLLDVLLNPSKHSAGENADAAKKVVDKILGQAGVDTKELRKSLEEYLGKQPKMTGGSQQKNMGMNLQRVLETARISMSILGVS
jgi:hypothetical protein